MTLVEFLYPVRKGKRGPQVLAVLYYFKHHQGQDSMRVGEIRQALIDARIPQARTINITQVLNEAVPFTNRVGPRGTWEITGKGEEEVRDWLALPAPEAEPEAEHDTGALERLAKNVQDDVVRDYVEEAIKCHKVGALRASVVFLWSGAVYTIREAIWSGFTTKQIAAALQKHNNRAKFAKKADFEYVNDALLIEAAVELGVYARSEKKRLNEALDLRNDCGHPVKYRPGVHKVSGFIEDVVGIVFP